MWMKKRTILASAILSALVMPTISLANNIEDNTVNTDFEVIVVSGTKTEKPLRDVAGSISVITQEDLEKQVTTDMNQLFKYDPSIQISGNTGDAQNFVVRGMGGDRILMIKDGMRMNEGYGADGLNDIVGRGFIETDILKQVEVAKGAASSLYGSDALGGIVVFSTKSASDYLVDGEKFAGKIKLGYSEQGKQQSIGTTLALATGDIEHLVNIAMRDGEESQNFDETKPELDIDSTSYFYNAKYTINANDFFSFSADIWDQEVVGNTAYGLLDYFRTLDGYDIVKESSTGDKKNKSFQLRYHSESATPFYDQLNISIYQNKTTQENVEYGQLDINANFGFPVIELRDMWKTSVYQQETQGFLSNASLNINTTHTLGYGLDIEKSESKRTEVKLYAVEGTPKNGYPQTADKFPKTEVSRAGFYVNDEITLLNGQLTVTPGARFDTYDMDPNNATKENGEAYKKFDQNNLSFNLGALYRINDSVALFAQYGQGFKVPAYDLAYIDHDNSIYGYKIVPSDDLSPEESDAYEIGLRGQVSNFFFSAAIYYNEYEKFLSTALIDIETSTNPYSGEEAQVLVYQYQNIDSVTTKGIEVAGRYYLNDIFSIFANAAYQDGKNDETDEYITSITPLSGVAGVAFEQEDLSAELIVNWAKRMDKVNVNNIEVAGYGTLDLLMSYELNDDLKFNVAANNLTNKKFVRYINGAGHASNASLDNITEAGRTISANIHYSF
ncbi:TonB-dependent hemoglobin/transferrin/lactoferrin family receptor [Thalassotalea piscium]|uniref:Hemoglobin/transferrin/lactoferrin receptor protein n=1 Tax=Thalassotalea piscium TaxID=1230533 RepID=A0A7X0NFX0_9GAMM|nr:TonB-dependent hemoglobin/transferrin/lactoferrin family receptor [Thalassotalea piscium]MBB6542724.1 hemoglobin/transferrin/lactoferrin receptor protein [Thalassotalea piscium]